MADLFSITTASENLVIPSPSPADLMMHSKEVMAKRGQLPSKTSFLSLPLELRTLIYEFMFTPKESEVPVEIWDQRAQDLAHWLKHIDMRFSTVFDGTYHEALPIAFACIPFRICDRHFYGQWRNTLIEGQTPEETDLLHMLTEEIRTVYVDLRVLGRAGTHFSWATPVRIPRRLQTIVIDNPPGKWGNGPARFSWIWGSQQSIHITLRGLRERGLKVFFLPKDFTQSDIEQYERNIAAPGNETTLTPLFNKEADCCCYDQVPDDVYERYKLTWA